MSETTTTEKPLTQKQQKQAERKEAIAKLRKWLRPGKQVFTILRQCSRSGMSRHISLVIASGKGEMFDISYWASRAMGDRLANDGGIIIGGCGMDMGFALVYNLGRTLWPKGFKLPKGKRGRNGDTSGFDTDGGYALEQRWL